MEQWDVHMEYSGEVLLGHTLLAVTDASAFRHTGRRASSYKESAG